MTKLSYVRMVLWSFLDIRRRTGAAREAVAVKLAPLGVTVVLLAACVVAGLAGVAFLAAGALR